MFVRNLGSKGKWMKASFDKINRSDAFLSGDVISDLRTRDNKLSVWEVEGEEDKESIKSIIVTLALGRDRINKVEYVLIDEQNLLDIAIGTENEPGGSEVMIDQDVLNKHKNLTDIDYWRLGFLAQHIAELVDKNKGQTIKKSELKLFIRELYDQGKLDLTKVNKKMKESLNDELGLQLVIEE